MSQNIKIGRDHVRVVTSVGPIVGTLTEFVPSTNRVTIVTDSGITWQIAAKYVYRMEDAS